MFLSKIYLNPGNMNVLRDISDFYEMHRTISRFFPDVPGEKSAREKFNILFRIDFQMSINKLELLIQSNYEPTFDSFLIENPHYFLEPPEILNLDSFLDSITENQIYRFKLKANPTVKLYPNLDPKGKKGAKNGKRVPIKHEDKQMEWLVKKGDKNGFQPVLIKVSGESPIYDFTVGKESEFIKEPYKFRSKVQANKDSSKKSPITLYSVIYQGNLIIKNREQFLTAVKNGVGPAKAFGFGLLSVFPNN